MGEMDEILRNNLKKTKFAILVEKSREKLRCDEEKGINKTPVAAKPVKVIDMSNKTLFTQETINKYADDKNKGFEPGE